MRGNGKNIILREGIGIFLCITVGMRMGIRSWEWERMGTKNSFPHMSI